MTLGKPITADGLKNAFLELKVGEKTLLGLIRLPQHSLKGTIEWGTMKNYFHDAEVRSATFLKTKLKRVRYSTGSLSYKFIVEFEFYLRSYQPLTTSQIGNNTMMKHIERLRKITSVAIKNECWSEIHLRSSKLSSFEMIGSI